MKVERDIAGFALPFAGGVLVTAYSGTIFHSLSSYIHIIASSAILMTLMLLLQRQKLKFARHITDILIGAAAMGCGALCAATDMFLLDMPQSELMNACNDIGLRMQSLIDTIPFKSDDTSALIKALLTGERTSLSTEIKTTFRSSGASHILALSGLHLGIIYGILSWVLSILGNSKAMRILRSAIIIMACGAYTLATGAGDSLVRAFIFIFLREIARVTCRYHGLGQILLTSLIIQLVIDPSSIRSVSFQLSYAAMAGIAFIYPWLQGFWERAGKVLTTREEDDFNKADGPLSRPTRWIWNTVALSIACQLTTGPLAYLYFGTFPKYFMLTNLLTLPLTGILIPTALLTLCLSAIGYCPSIMVQATEWFAETLIWMMQVISTM